MNALQLQSRLIFSTQSCPFKLHASMLPYSGTPQSCSAILTPIEASRTGLESMAYFCSHLRLAPFFYFSFALMGRRTTLKPQRYSKGETGPCLLFLAHPFFLLQVGDLRGFPRKLASLLVPFMCSRNWRFFSWLPYAPIIVCDTPAAGR